MRQNAARLNRMQIREQEALNKERRMQDDAVSRREADAMRRTKAQYGHISSHGYGRTGDRIRGDSGGDRNIKGGLANMPFNAAQGRDTDNVEIRVYVRECDENASQSFCYHEHSSPAGSSGTYNSTATPSPIHRGTGSPKSSASRCSQLETAGNAAGSDARVLPPITSNRPGATRYQPSGSPAAVGSAGSAGSGVVAPNRARVPRYLQQRKAELAAEKEALATEAERQRQMAEVPAGQRRVTEEEKAETLRNLDERQQELENQLGRIPIRFDTQSIQQRRRNIEDELRQIEATRSKYSTKGPLFVPLF